MNLNNQIELELYFADHFDTILFPVLAEMYLEQNDLRRARKVQHPLLWRSLIHRVLHGQAV